MSRPRKTSSVVARGGYATRRAQTGTFNVVMTLNDKVVGTLGPYQTRRAALADARTLAYRKADTTPIVTLKSGNKAPLARVHRDFADAKQTAENGYYLKSRRGKAEPLGFFFEVAVVDANRSPVRPNPNDAGVRSPAPASNRKPRRNGAAQLTAHQEKALRYIVDNSYGGNHPVEVDRGEVGIRTAHALEKMGLVTLEAHSGMGGWKKIGGFAGKYKGREQRYQSDVTALLTPEGKALAVSLLAPKKNPRRNGSMPHHTEVQSLLFHKAAFPVGKAKSWAKHHGFSYGRVDKGGERANMLRLRQHDPSDYVPGSFRTIVLTDGVEAVIGLPKEAA